MAVAQPRKEEVIYRGFLYNKLKGNSKVMAIILNGILWGIMHATNMDFDDNYFDVVLISLVLHEVDDTVRHKIMKEGKRVLKNKGKIIIIEWAKPKKIFRNF